MEAITTYLKNASKQLIVALVVGVILFFVWPGATTLFFAGMAAGILVGNFYPAVESAAEKILKRS